MFNPMLKVEDAYIFQKPYHLFMYILWSLVNPIQFYAYLVDFCFRHKLNVKNRKVDNPPIRKPNTYSTRSLSAFLSTASNNEDFKDDANTRSLSKPLVGGGINTCKIRVLKFRQRECIPPGLLYYGLYNI